MHGEKKNFSDTCSPRFQNHTQGGGIETAFLPDLKLASRFQVSHVARSDRQAGGTSPSYDLTRQQGVT
jgi:hypothetical protein